MSHFLCPGSTTPHYIFGRPEPFLETCTDLALDVLAQIPIEPAVSARGDAGSPIVMLDAEDGHGQAKQAFLGLAQRVWQRLHA